ncbi:MAG: hypothetical protein V3U41_09300 [candidate division NC10 bacterium]
MRRASLFLSFLLLLLATAACDNGIPASYSARPIRGKVVVATTDQPLEGVIIVAQWILYDTGVGGQNPRKRLQVLETVTAPDGSYAFPSWGPKPNPTNIDKEHAYACCFLTNRDPKLSFFRPGYRPLTVLNQRSSDSAMRTSDWDGRTIELQPFKESRNKWARELVFLQGSLGWNDLEWRTCPRMVVAIEEERLRHPFGEGRWISSLESLGTSREEILRHLGKRP